MGKGRSSSVQQSPDQQQGTDLAEVQAPESELLAAQRLAGGGNSWVQEQMQAQLSPEASADAGAVQDAAQTITNVVQGGDVAEAAPEIDAAIEEGQQAIEGLEEGGGITGEAPPTDPGAGGGEAAPAVEQATGPAAESEAAAPTSAEPAQEGGEDVRTKEAKEFSRIWRTTSAEETDAWLDGLEAREAANPALAGLTAELRAWVQQKRAARAAQQAPQAPAPDATPPVPATSAEAEEGGGWWDWFTPVRETASAAWDTVVGWWEGAKATIRDGWRWLTGAGEGQQVGAGQEQTAGSQGPTMPTGPQDYDEAAAQAFMDQMYEAYTTIPITFEVDGKAVSVQVQAKYRNFGTDSDWKGALAASVEEHGVIDGVKQTWDFKKMLTSGKATDKVEHSEGFAQSYAGKATPEELRQGVQEAVDADTDLQAKLAEAYQKGEADARKVLEDWCQRKLGLDCIGFAWNLINGSHMYDHFTPGPKGSWDTEREKEENLACSGFMKYAKNIHDAPESWRALDCLVDSGHILVVYRVTEQDGGVRKVELMQSSGSTGVNRVTYYFGKGKKKGGAQEATAKWYTDSALTKSVGHSYEVYRPENSDAHAATLQK